MVNVTATAQALSDDFAKLANAGWIGLATGGDPSGQPVEIPAGASGYARVQTTNWTSAGGGVNVGDAVTISAPAGEYTFVILCTKSAPDQPGDALIDYCKITGVILNTDGTVVVTPQYTQT